MAAFSLFKNKEKKEEAKEEKKEETKTDKKAASTATAAPSGSGGLGVAKPGEKISIIRLVDTLIEQSAKLRSSDIHLDPEETLLRVRLRIDGVMHDSFVLPKSIHSEIITRIKVMAGLRTDEHAAAQDGRLQAKIDSKKVDVRVSIAPTYHGENCVMRILAAGDEEFTLEKLGFAGVNLERINKAVEKPYGMILATGPTGSGKTTTLYTILRKITTKEVVTITIEDPVEYSIEGIEQIQVNPRTGLTFANGLRFILRQDPDIVMVGEIRDGETASIAVNAALTGHLMLSTLHTNDATTTIPRLLDMGVEPFLIASTLNVAIGQRLIRKLCQNCRVEKKLSAAELENLKKFVSEKLLNKHKGKTFYDAKGCSKCSGGYIGRVGIHEVLEIDAVIRELIMKKASGDEIREVARKNGMVTMLEDGFEKSLKGETTLEEVLRVFYE